MTWKYVNEITNLFGIFRQNCSLPPTLFPFKKNILKEARSSFLSDGWRKTLTHNARMLKIPIFSLTYHLDSALECVLVEDLLNLRLKFWSSDWYENSKLNGTTPILSLNQRLWTQQQILWSSSLLICRKSLEVLIVCRQKFVQKVMKLFDFLTRILLLLKKSFDLKVLLKLET